MTGAVDVIAQAIRTNYPMGQVRDYRRVAVNIAASLAAAGWEVNPAGTAERADHLDDALARMDAEHQSLIALYVDEQRRRQQAEAQS